MKLNRLFAAVAVLLAPSLATASSETFDRSMAPVVDSYLTIQKALSSDSTAGIAAAAKAIEKLSKALDAKSVTGEHAGHYTELPAKLQKAAAKVAGTTDIATTREAFKDLSKPMAMWATMSKPKGLVVVYCSMAKGSWLQKKGPIRNPYYGASMLACGEIVGGDN